ncbi:SPFH domain-containing protein [Streptomyces sp. NPDC090022]|uniref:SPFH domain-containing protein n=1 Tax=Streptomyces sp. NPDC090022 TaxID=3365920 RepID=UPI00381CC469
MYPTRTTFTTGTLRLTPSRLSSPLSPLSPLSPPLPPAAPVSSGYGVVPAWAVPEADLPGARAAEYGRIPAPGVEVAVAQAVAHAMAEVDTLDLPRLTAVGGSLVTEVPADLPFAVPRAPARPTASVDDPLPAPTASQGPPLPAAPSPATPLSGPSAARAPQPSGPLPQTPSAPAWPAGPAGSPAPHASAPAEPVAADGLEGASGGSAAAGPAVGLRPGTRADAESTAADRFVRPVGDHGPQAAYADTRPSADEGRAPSPLSSAESAAAGRRAGKPSTRAFTDDPVFATGWAAASVPGRTAPSGPDASDASRSLAADGLTGGTLPGDTYAAHPAARSASDAERRAAPEADVRADAEPHVVPGSVRSAGPLPRDVSGSGVDADIAAEPSYDGSAPDPGPVAHGFVGQATDAAPGGRPRAEGAAHTSLPVRPLGFAGHPDTGPAPAAAHTGPAAAPASAVLRGPVADTASSAPSALGPAPTDGAPHMASRPAATAPAVPLSGDAAVGTGTTDDGSRRVPARSDVTRGAAATGRDLKGDGPRPARPPVAPADDAPRVGPRPDGAAAATPAPAGSAPAEAAEPPAPAAHSGTTGSVPTLDLPAPAPAPADGVPDLALSTPAAAHPAPADGAPALDLAAPAAAHPGTAVGVSAPDLSTPAPASTDGVPASAASTSALADGTPAPADGTPASTPPRPDTAEGTGSHPVSLSEGAPDGAPAPDPDPAPGTRRVRLAGASLGGGPAALAGAAASFVVAGKAVSRAGVNRNTVPDPDTGTLHRIDTAPTPTPTPAAPRTARPVAVPPRRVPLGDARLREVRGPVLPGWAGVLVGLVAVVGCAGVLWRAGVLPAQLVAAFGAEPRPYAGLRAYHWPPLAFLGIVALLALGGLGRGKVGHAWVLTLFGRYRGTVRRAGLLWISPLLLRRRVDVRIRHWRSEPMPAVDAGGLALRVVVQVVWRVKDTARATFAVADHTAYLAEQVESAMARVLSQLPADAFHEDAPTLRDAEAVGDALTRMLAVETEAIGIEVYSAQPTRIEYAPEVAAAMQRRRVAAIDAKHRDSVLTSVVDAVDDTVNRLTTRGLVELDDYERKALVKDLTVAFYTGRAE